MDFNMDKSMGLNWQDTTVSSSGFGAGVLGFLPPDRNLRDCKKRETKEESEKHDAIFVHEALATLEDKEKGYGASKHWDIVRKNLDWFRKNNAKAYMVLLD